MHSMWEETMKDIDYLDDKEIFEARNMMEGFERALCYCLANKSYILSIYNNGFGSLIQKIFNTYIEDFAGDMSLHSLEIYKLYFISGAVFNVLIQWLQRGAVESPREIARVCVSYFEGGIAFR